MFRLDRSSASARRERWPSPPLRTAPIGNISTGWLGDPPTTGHVMAMKPLPGAETGGRTAGKTHLLADPLKRKQQFFALNGLRFLGAFWILVFHTSIHVGRLNALEFVQPLINEGPLAMTLFFVLSGFVLAHTYRQFADQHAYHFFFAARLARLYPVYIFVGVVTVWQLRHGLADFTLVVQHGVLGAFLLAGILLVIFLFVLQAWIPPLFVVWNFGGTWAISVDAFLYLVFPKLRMHLASLGTKLLRLVVYGMPLLMLAMLFGLLASQQSNDDSSARLFYVLPIFRLPEFVFGIGGFILFVERGRDLRLLTIAGSLLSVLLGACI